MGFRPSMSSLAISWGQAFRAGHWPSLVGAWLHFEVSFMVWLLIGALGVAIAQEFALTATQKGFLVATPLLGGALLRLVVGPFADQFGAKQVGLSLLLVEALALLLGWQVGKSYVHMLGTGLLLGFAGASFAVALPIASQAYPPAHQGLAMGVAAVGNSGVLLSTFFAPRIAAVVGWHATFGAMLIPVLVTALVFWLLVPSRPGLIQQGRPFTLAQFLGDLLTQRFLYWVCFLYGVTFGGFVGLSSFLPLFFHDHYQINMVAAGTLTAVCGLAGSLARPVGGYLADRMGGIPLLQVVLPGIAIGCLLLSTLLPLEWTLPLMIGTVLLLGFGNGVVFQVVSLRFQGMMGTASGFVGAAGGLGGFLVPAWFGLLRDATGTFASGFLVLAGLSLIAGVSAVWIQRFGRVLVESSSER
ncbi:MAG: NarK/NasA family nitrate transporter [Nitrospirae bacterium]|nr:MAG: NarK/NasA family nitrate transporter [Nitrospirota bacterium]